MLLLGSQSFPNYGLNRFFEFAKKLNFSGVEITITNNFDTQNFEYLKMLEKESGIKICAFSLPSTNAENLLPAFAKVVSEFPGRTINLASPEVFSFDYKKFIDKEIPKLCRNYRLSFHRTNSPFKTMFGILPTRSQSSLHTLREAGTVCLDLSALWRSHADIMRATDFLADKMQHVYLSNVRRNKMYMPLRDGILPVESLLTKLARENFRGDFTLKIAPENMDAGNDKKMLDNLKDAKEVFEKYFGAN